MRGRPAAHRAHPGTSCGPGPSPESPVLCVASTGRGGHGSSRGGQESELIRWRVTHTLVRVRFNFLREKRPGRGPPHAPRPRLRPPTLTAARPATGEAAPVARPVPFLMGMQAESGLVWDRRCHHKLPQT